MDSVSQRNFLIDKRILPAVLTATYLPMDGYQHIIIAHVARKKRFYLLTRFSTALLLFDEIKSAAVARTDEFLTEPPQVPLPASNFEG